MTTLQTRLAQADKPTRELLEEAFEAVFPPPGPDGYLTEPVDWSWDRSWDRYRKMLDAKAWTSAVEMLVPADWPRRTYDPRGLLGLPATASVTANPCGQIVTIEADAAHPALALAIACLKARGL